LLDEYAKEEFKEQRVILAGLLSEAAKRLGPPKPESDLGDPDFMVVHALNRINPDNWRDAIVQGKTDRQSVGNTLLPLGKATISSHCRTHRENAR
jgi:hypothetical protein